LCPSQGPAFSVPWVGHICSALRKIGNSCPELLLLSHIWSMGQQLAPLVIPSFLTKILHAQYPPCSAGSLGFCGLLLRLQPRMAFSPGVLASFCPPVAKFPLLCLLSRIFLLYCYGLHCVDVYVRVCVRACVWYVPLSQQTVGSWRAGLRWIVRKPGTLPKG
jgi:hypothetical protein